VRIKDAGQRGIGKQQFFYEQGLYGRGLLQIDQMSEFARLLDNSTKNPEVSIIKSCHLSNRAIIQYYSDLMSPISSYIHELHILSRKNEAQTPELWPSQRQKPGV
jgi:hypothetical protein